MNESGLVANIVKEVHRRWPDAWVFKVAGSPYQMVGVPDLLIVVDGLLIGAEVKYPRPGESPDQARQRATATQRAQIRRINHAGGMAGVVVSVEEAVGLVQRGLAHRNTNKEKRDGNSEGG